MRVWQPGSPSRSAWPPPGAPASMPTTLAGRPSSLRPARPWRAKRSLPPVPSAGSGWTQNPFFRGNFFVTGGEARDHQEGVGQEAKGDVAVPGAPLPDLVMVHPNLSFCLFEGELYGPALLAGPYQLLNRRILGTISLVEGEVVGIFGATASQQPPAHPLLRVCGELQACPLPGAPLAGVLYRKVLRPSILGQPLGELLYLLLAPSEIHRVGLWDHHRVSTPPLL